MALFTVPFTATVTAAGGNADLWEVLPDNSLPCKIRGIRLGQTSEIGDAQEEGLRISILRMSATVTSSNGTTGVPVGVDKHSQSPAFTSKTNGTTIATTSGASETIEELSWNIRNSPFEIWYPDPAFAPRAIEGEGLFVRLQTTPADDFTFAGTLWVEEG
jgi:hypothetical protein